MNEVFLKRKTMTKFINISTHINFKMLLILGLWISNSILGCQGIPQPTPSSNNYDYRPNYAIDYGAPLIVDGDELTLEPNLNYSIRCEAKVPIEWKLFQSSLLHEIQSFKEANVEFPYVSILHLLNINYTYVGYYFCVKKESANDELIDNLSQESLTEKVNDNTASSIYIYVNDKNHLLVDLSVSMIMAFQDFDTKIPCKPTTPDVKVSLTQPGSDTDLSGSRYDPRQGFIVKLSEEDSSGLYECKAQIPGTQEEELKDIPVKVLGNDYLHFKTNHIQKPTITSVTHGHVYEGETFNLTCQTEKIADVLVTALWQLPFTDNENRTNILKASIVADCQKNYQDCIRTVLIVKNAKKSDSGLYHCKVEDHSLNTASESYLMTVLTKGESFINISEPNNYYTISEKAGKSIQIAVKYLGHPFPSLQWHRPDGSEIHPSNKYNITTTDKMIVLKVLNIQMKESGTYTLRAANGIITKELKFNVSISDAPVASVENVYVKVGEEAHITCKVLSYPKAMITWSFTPCSIKPRWPKCLNGHDRTLNGTNSLDIDGTIESIHEISFKPTTPGVINCKAQNNFGIHNGKGQVLIGEIDGNMVIYGMEDDQKIARGDELILTCEALAYFYTGDLEWFKDNDIVTLTDDIHITSSITDYSYKKSLEFKNIQDLDRGSYECRARNVTNNDLSESRYVSLFVHEPSAPKLSALLETKINRKLGEPLELECASEAIPRAQVKWYKDEVLIPSNSNSSITFSEQDTKLLIRFLKPEDEGNYKCIVSNRLGAQESSTTVYITNLPGMKLGWIIGMSIFFLILVILVIYLFVRVKRERKLLRELKAAGLANFEKGDMDQMNPALTVDEQADLLPYDSKFEFPRNKLCLSKQLGAGAFGVVLKATAEGIKPEEKESVVAVKMVKRTADNEVMRALVSELKIMVHLGQHLNVVNLLGAVTKNIAKRELMIIVEYCRYGNVQNFLLRNRKRFINQINTESDRIDPTITIQRFSDNFELNRANTENDPRSGTRPGRPNSKGYLRTSDLYDAAQIDSCATEQTTVAEDDENILSNNSVQPAWRSNYKTDSTEAMTITTSDLVSWAFQVARGMDYLSSKKVLHGDLAARNILLCEDNVVKICDFGLARSMYKSDNYKKQGEARLPIKWLALESLSDHVFSTYTDVWSFGIVLWEFFSLAKVPYPGMDPNQNLYLKLKDGYRMEKPPFANDELYDIMLECWSTNPESRPLFNKLEKKFARMLGDEVTTHYVDLNEPYLRSNTEYMRRTQTDYLALMGSPDEIAPPVPRYVNGYILPEIRIEASSDDYLNMNTNTGTAIFSPTRPKDLDSDNDEPKTTTSFTFPEVPDTTVEPQHSPTLTNNLDSPVNKNRRKQITGGIQQQEQQQQMSEEIPMLHNTKQYTDENIDDSPEQPRKFNARLQQTRQTPTPSPRHHYAETPLNENNGNDDNYVNVRSPTSTTPKKMVNNNNNVRGADAFSNPSYQIHKTVNEHGK